MGNDGGEEGGEEMIVLSEGAFRLAIGLAEYEGSSAGWVCVDVGVGCRSGWGPGGPTSTSTSPAWYFEIHDRSSERSFLLGFGGEQLALMGDAKNGRRVRREKRESFILEDKLRDCVFVFVRLRFCLVQ